MNHFDYDSLDYFWLKVLRLRIGTLFQVFRRSLNDGVVQGISLVQIGTRHAFYIGSERGALRLCLAFAWLTRPAS